MLMLDEDGEGRCGLPVELTPLVGRSRELDELRDVLPTTRLLTLVGVGGAGKSRLALAVAGSLDVSACQVELGTVNDPELLPHALAAALGLGEVAVADLPSTAARRLAGAQVLVLDNCEHVAGACAELAAKLLAACPTLTVIATSRARARRRGRARRPCSGARALVGRRRGTVRRRHALSRAGALRGAVLRPGARDASRHRAAVPAPGWPPSGHRAGRRPGQRAHGPRDRRANRARPLVPAPAGAPAPNRPPHPAGDLRLQPRAADALRSGAVAPPVSLRSELRAARGGGRRRWRRARPRRGPRRARRARRQVAGDDRGATAADPVPAARHVAPVRRRAARDERRGGSRAGRPRRLPPDAARAGGRRKLRLVDAGRGGARRAARRAAPYARDRARDCRADRAPPVAVLAATRPVRRGAGLARPGDPRGGRDAAADRSRRVGRRRLGRLPAVRLRAGNRAPGRSASPVCPAGRPGRSTRSPAATRLHRPRARRLRASPAAARAVPGDLEGVGRRARRGRVARPPGLRRLARG